jgi:MinD-like ATPase involved in chromosome partitioning or flagellar assembly
MSKDDTGSTEGQGLPGYSANNSIPGGFTLPLPALAPEQSDQGQASADPWSTTWDDNSWQQGSTRTPETGVNDWSDSYDYGGEYTAEYETAYTNGYSHEGQNGSSYGSSATGSYNGSSYNGSYDSGTSYTGSYDAGSYNGSYDTESVNGSSNGSSNGSYEGSYPGSYTGASADPYASGSYESESADHWSTLQHDADTAAASQEEYSGWTPAGYTEPASESGSTGASVGGGHYSTDHSAAQEAYAATPAVDPDVAAVAAERGYDPQEPAYDLHRTDGPHADDLITARQKGERNKTKASSGLRRAFGLGPGVKELIERDRIDRIARPLNGRKTIMVINTKGGGGKTLVTLMLATYLGRYRSGSVLAWDNNETEGTLGMRAPSQSHHRTVVDLLGALPQIANDPNAGTSELEHWVREQRGLSFDVLASADDDEAMRIVGEQEFEDLHTQLSRFYRMIVVDTGNNRLSPNWLSAAARADMLVFATSLKDDTSVVAAKNLDALVSMGRGDLVRNAVCVISHTAAKGNDVGAGVHTREHFEQWVRAVVDIPYDPALAPGLHLDPLKISKKTHESCMEMAAVVVDGL